MNSILTMSSIIFPLITFPYVSRILLPVGTGKVAFAVSLVTYFSMFAQLGVPTYGIRACAQIRDNREQLTKTVHELLFINLSMNIIAYVAFFASLIFIPRLQTERPLYCIVSLTIILTSIGMEWLYKALEKYSYITIRSLIFKAIAVVFMFLLVRSKEDYVIYGGISIFAASASNILNFINSHKYIDYKRLDNYDIKRHLKPIMIFFAITCAATIYTHVDTLMLGFLTSDIDVGYYDAAIRVKTILVSFITSLGTVLLPRSSYYVNQGLMDEFWRISKKALNFIILFATPILVFFILYADNTIYLLSGKAYTESILPMQILMPTLLFIGLTNILGIQILVPTDREQKVLFSVIIGAIVDVIINIVLIPKLASSGAAIGTVVAEFAVLLYQLTVLKENDKYLFSGVHYIRVLIGATIAATASLWTKGLDTNNFVILVAASIFYFGIYSLFMLLRREEMFVELLTTAKAVMLKIKK